MGIISIAAFTPKPGCKQDLLDVIADRLPIQLKLGLVTERKPMLMESRSGVIIQVSEWTSREAIGVAHQTPEVLALWERFDACSTYVKLDSLDESHDDFASFEALDA